MSSPQIPVVTPLPCFLDNYIWHLATNVGDWVVDPGDAQVVIDYQTSRQRPLIGILITHHHADHTAGIAALHATYGMPVYGPREVREGISQYVNGNDTVTYAGLGRVRILSVGAHTKGHIAYYLADSGLLFCGDSLFSAGCGRLFEGNAADLAAVMATYVDLPESTHVFPTHEYTAANIRFAQAVEPSNTDLNDYADTVARWRKAGQPSLPTTLARERAINPFLRSDVPAVIAAASQYAGTPLAAGEQTLATLRAWKDVF